MAASRYQGVTLAEIAEAFSVYERTAQPMVRALVQTFPHAIDVYDGDDRRRHWKLREMPVARMRLRGAEELEAIESGISALNTKGDARQARALGNMRDRLMAALPPAAARAAEADADAMLEARGVAARPGPVVHVDRDIADTVTEALKGPYRLNFSYSNKMRDVEPYGILIGLRRYLVARQVDDDVFRHFRFDRIEDAEVSTEWFARDPDFNLNAHAERAFGAYQNDAEFGEVIWRFTPEAATRAAEWKFHPTQTSELLPDDLLGVRITASGWLEMAWHLICRGDSVEVVGPAALKGIVADPQRNGDILP